MPAISVLPPVDLYAINTYLKDQDVLQDVVSRLQQLGHLTPMEVSAMLGLTRLATAPQLERTELRTRHFGCDTFGYRFIYYLNLVVKCTSHGPSTGSFESDYVLLNVLSQNLGVHGLYDYFLACCQCAKHLNTEEAMNLWEEYLTGLQQRNAFPVSQFSALPRGVPATREDMLRHLKAFVTGVATWPP